jgi:phospholipid N-methyltransferase
MTTKEVLQQCKVDGNIIKLPNIQLDRKDYTEVKKQLELIGGKWKGGKTQGFVFEEDPTELLEQIASGEKRNLKKEFQFFPTPDELADRLVSKAIIYSNSKILEPSAGRGAIVKAINRNMEGLQVDCFELMELNQTSLKKVPTANIIGDDFLQTEIENEYDIVIANPPFSKNQDIEHIRKMFQVVKPGGTIITIASKHWQSSSNKKETEFRDWLKEFDPHIEEIEAGEFKESGTMVGAVLLVFDKPFTNESSNENEELDEPISTDTKEVATVPKIEKRWLRYDFEPDEVHQLSVEMANKVQELQQVEQEKKSVTSSYTSRANSLKSHINDLSNKVASGYESREIDCLVKYHEPKQGWKTLIRKDNSKKIEERMLPSEWTLFTQPLENEELETV